MAIPNKPIALTRITVPGEYPQQVPRLPESAFRLIPELVEWQSQNDKWWFDLRTILQRERDEFMRQVNEQINKLESRVAALENE